MTTTDLIVAKVGTSSVTTPDGRVDTDVLAAVARDVATLRARGVAVIVVTSGAITAGWAEVGAGAPRPQDPVTLQAVSAVGQPLLMDAWRAAFAGVSLPVGQVLLAPLDFSHRAQYLHARRTLAALNHLGVVPIVNENDAVADQEIRFGDNDRLAALVANVVGAREVVLLTDTPGLLTADPRLDPNATLIEEVTAIDRALEEVAGASRSGVGSGGMASKLAAARVATWSGVAAVIAPARVSEPLVAAHDRRPGSGTFFTPRADRLTARKAWIAFAGSPAGSVRVNTGAAEALVRDKRSLLRVGVTHAEGDFVAGDVIDVLGPSGELLARGIARVDCEDWEDVTDVFVHRDDLVVLLSA